MSKDKRKLTSYDKLFLQSSEKLFPAYLAVKEEKGFKSYKDYVYYTIELAQDRKSPFSSFVQKMMKNAVDKLYSFYLDYISAVSDYPNQFEESQEMYDDPESFTFDRFLIEQYNLSVE